MKKYIPYILLAIVLIYFLTRKAEKEVITVEIPVPVVSHTFDTIRLPGDIIYRRRIDTVLVDNYISAPQNVKDSLYKEAITLREYNQRFEDSVQKVDVFTKVRGWLTEQTVSYETKPREVSKEIPVPSKIHLYIGGGARFPINTFDTRPAFGAQALIQNKKGNMLGVSYDTDNTIGINYIQKVF